MIKYALNRKVYLKFSIIFFLLIIPLGADIVLEREWREEQPLRQFISVAFFLIKHFIAPHTNTLVVQEKCIYVCEIIKKLHRILLDLIVKNLSDTLSVQLYFGDSKQRPWDYNLFVIDSWTTFESLRLAIPPTNYERDYYFFILLTHSLDRLLSYNLEKIFDLCLRLNVNNVVVMNRSLGSFIGFYSYQLYSWNICGENVLAQEVNRFENGYLEFPFLFPKILPDFFGCPLTISTDNVEPLIIFDGDAKNSSHLQDMKYLGGIEGEILKLLATALNFKIHVHFSEEIGRIDTNSSGCFKDLQDNAADIAIGGLGSTMDVDYLFTKSFAYHTTPYKFVVRSNVLFGPIEQLINPLDKTTWILLLVFFAVAIIFILIIKHLKLSKIYNFIFGPKNQNPIFNTFITFLGYSMPEQVLPQRNFARFILMSWLLFTMEIRNGYLGKMFDSLRLAKRMPIPKTLTELINMEYILLNPDYTIFYPENKTRIWDNTSYVLNEVQESHEFLTAAVLIEYLAHYNFHNRNKSSLVPVRETIYPYQLVMYFRKHSLLRNSFDQRLKLLTNSGITSHIAKQYIYTNFLNMISQTQDVGGITFYNLLGLYYIYGVMCLLALIVFVMEMLSTKSRRVKVIMDWLN